MGAALVPVVAGLVITVAAAWLLGRFMARVYSGDAKWAQPILGPVERSVLRVVGVGAEAEMTWRDYAQALLVFNLLGTVLTYAIQRFQSLLPLNPRAASAVAPEIAFNTAVSFVTNTNWQAYGGEISMSHLTQMVALTVQNFLSAATGMAVAIALIRGFVRRRSSTVGNFWVDVTRSVLYVLLPLSLVLSLALVSQGVVQTFAGGATIDLVEPTRDGDGHPVAHQTLALGPVASQVAIKQLGTNGGGHFNANSAHPFENPTPASNALELMAILLLPAAFCFTFGSMVGSPRHGWALLLAMLLLVAPCLALCMTAERAGNPLLASIGIDQAAGNMEGKEVRFGAALTCVPLQSGPDTFGVIALERPSRDMLQIENRAFLDAFVRQAGLAIERARLAEQARVSTLRARTEQMRSSLLSAVSHDLRTPLAAITGAGTALRDDQGRLDAAQRAELFDTICVEADRMERLVGNILDMVRLESGGIRPKRGWVPLEEVVGSALARLGSPLAGRDVQLDLPSDLPLVLVDPILLEQVFVNLVENATKYASGPIGISARCHKSAVEIAVTDSGPGLPPGHEARVFEKFYRGPGAPGGGVGLGLAICLGIVNAHGGSITAANRPGGGAVFTVCLPIEAEPPPVGPIQEMDTPGVSESTP